MDQVNQLKSAYPDDYTKVLSVEDGQIKLNVVALHDLEVARAREALTTAYQTAVAGKWTDALREQYDIARAYYSQVLNNAVFSATSATDAATVLKDSQSAYNDLLKDTISMLKQEKNDQKSALQDQLDGYKKIIDAQKTILDQKQKEADFQDALAGKNKELSDIDNQLLALQFDNSEAAKAKRLILEDDKAKKLKDINKLQSDNTVQTEKNALDKDYDNFKEKIDSKIKVIDDYLKHEGNIAAQAIALLSSKSDAFYQRLIEWNRKFGSGVDSDITNAWNKAALAMQNYANVAQDSLAKTAAAAQNLSIVLSGIGRFSVGDMGDFFNLGGMAGNVFGLGDKQGSKFTFGTYHDGGTVGNIPKLKEGEEFAKLMNGEHVSTGPQMVNFMNNVLPAMVTAAVAGGGDTNISVTIPVNGNLDRSVVPLIESSVLNAVNKAMTTMGYKRSVKAFSI
jgi:hypothetical protein